MRGLPLTLFAILVFAFPAISQSAHITKKDREIVRFFQHHPRLAATPAGSEALLKASGHLLSAIRSLQAAKALYPPDHVLWQCISQYEAAKFPDGTPNWQTGAGATDTSGHYGGLGMSWNWGGGIAGNAGDYTESQQEWAAHRRWAANGYSITFLYDQWYDFDGAAGCGTTG